MKIRRTRQGGTSLWGKNIKGQTLVETVFVIVLFFGMYFGLIKLFILITGKIATLDASHVSARSKIVRRSAGSGYWVFQVQPGYPEKFSATIFSKNVSPPKPILNSQGELVEVSRIITVYRFSYLIGKTITKMLNSPDPKYFKKCYPGAARD